MTGRTQEEMLVLRAQAGEHRAFEALYRAYHPSLIRFAYKLTGNEAMAADAVQDAWITLVRTLKDLERPAMFRARAFKAVRWRVIDIVRARKGDMVPLDEDAFADTVNPMTDIATPDQLLRLIDGLPLAERETVYLFYLEELQITEIATVMSVPIGTIKSRLNRARHRLNAQSCGEEP